MTMGRSRWIKTPFLLILIVAAMLMSEFFAGVAGAQRDRPYWRGGFSGQSADRFIIEDRYGQKERRPTGKKEKEAENMYPVKKMGARHYGGYSNKESEKDIFSDAEDDLTAGCEEGSAEGKEAELAEEKD